MSDFGANCDYATGPLPPKTSTVNRVRTPADDVVDAWWAEWVEDSRGLGIDVGARRTVLHQLAQQPEGVQRGVLRKARGQ